MSSASIRSTTHRRHPRVPWFLRHSPASRSAPEHLPERVRPIVGPRGGCFGYPSRRTRWMAYLDSRCSPAASPTDRYHRCRERSETISTRHGYLRQSAACLGSTQSKIVPVALGTGPFPDLGG